MCIVMALFSLAMVTQAQENTRREFWPEIDVYLHLNPKFRLFFLATVTRSEETRANVETTFGAHLDYQPHKNIRFRAGYRYSFSLSDTDPYRENRIVFEQTFTHPLPLDVVVTDRNREELRFVNGKFSVRYRNRLTFEREFTIGRFKPTPYVSGEVYYDSRFDTWNRNRIYVGFLFPVRRGFPLVKLIETRRQVVLDFYLMRQLDSRSSPSRIYGLGLAANVYF